MSSPNYPNVFTELPKATTVEQIEALLPYRPKPQALSLLTVNRAGKFTAYQKSPGCLRGLESFRTLTYA